MDKIYFGWPTKCNERMNHNKKIITLALIIVAASTATICYSPIGLDIQEKEYAQLLLSNNDLVVSNLEGPITNEKSVSSGTIPGSPNNYIFTFPANLPQTLFKANIKLVNLGNNHILNFGNRGLESTKKYLEESDISYFGEPSGEKSVIKNINGVKIALVSYNEFSNDIELEKNLTINEIKKVKTEADIVIVFSHWGAEYVKEPGNSIKKLAYEFIDVGADLIIGSHSHVTGFIEEYNGKRIYYSLGNFVFDQYFNEDVRRGLGVIVKIDKQTKQIEFEEKSFYLQNNGQTIEKTEQK
jgi:poly-gamma-glutamate capsule biosynthesis protein CapA/YwtB (metallophosphatase superfamily)